MLRRTWRGHLVADQADPLMAAITLTTNDKIVIGLVGVAISTGIFRSAARRLGWAPLSIAAALYLAGRFADLW